MKRINSSQVVDSILSEYEKALLESHEGELAARADLQAAESAVTAILQAAFDKVNRKQGLKSVVPQRRTQLRSTPLQSNGKNPRSERVERLRASSTHSEDDPDSQE